MATDSDHLLAVNLQLGFEEEYRIENPPSDLTYIVKTMKNEKSCLVDPCWELIDPTPDIHALFVGFNERFFWNKLLAVTVSWSKKMTTCAGICSYQGWGGLCYITLSEPLLKLRPRKDLVETMLHEMIHAYLFVTNNDRDREGHGPEFHKHMYRINAEAGTNITVYHDFHDEVRLYKVHAWRCDGPCRHKAPYYGMLRRATNRKPGPNDRWWQDHQAKCGGNFVKVEPLAEASANPQKKMPLLSDIRRYFAKTSGAAASMPNHNGTVVVAAKAGKENRAEGAAGTPPRRTIEAFSGAGHSLAGAERPGSPSHDYDVVRNHWLSKFHSAGSKPLKRKSEEKQGPSKRSPPRLEQCPRCAKTVPRAHWEAHDRACRRLLDKVNCPNCGAETDSSQVNEHLDMCLMQLVPAPTTKTCAYCSADVAEVFYEEHVENCWRTLFEKQAGDKLLCIVCDSYVRKDNLAQHREECVVEVFDDDDDDELA